MQAKSEDLSTLLKLQAVDLDILRTQKELENLPQVAHIKKIREKRAALLEKQEQVAALLKRAEAETMRLSTEDEMLAEKQRHAQELIDNAGADYRSVESHSKEMSGFAKRRTELDAKLTKLADDLQKIEGFQEQINSAVKAYSAEEMKVVGEYEQASGTLKSNIRDMKVEREELATSLPMDLLHLYDKSARQNGGVAIGRLEDDRCGICRSVIDGGRLIELRSSAPLGICPSCKRLLVIE